MTLRDHRWRIAGLALVAVILFAAKCFYSTASAGDLSWILAPTSALVSLVSGAEFVYDAGQGWVSRDVMFIIAPECSGMNFLMASFLALSLGWLPGMRTGRDVVKRLAIAAGIAYAATLVINTIRIAIAIAMHRGTIDLGGWDKAELHRIEGIVVYLGGLCALYALARVIEHRSKRDALVH